MSNRMWSSPARNIPQREPPLLGVHNLSVRFEMGGLFRSGASVQAIDDVSFEVHTGDALGIVGESGCGKSTLVRCILQLAKPTGGEITWRGRSMHARARREMRGARLELQPVFQDPRSSLDPRMTVEEIVMEPLRIAGVRLAHGPLDVLMEQALGRVGLPAVLRHRYPHELSGGQCQRVAIARALTGDPALLVCDEPVSALDVSVQAQIINLLRRLQRELGLTMLFVSHNLAVVRYVSSHVLVLYLGRTMERAPATALFSRPCHPYTRALLAAVPDPAPRQTFPEKRTGKGAPHGDLPSALAPPSGCVYRTRCTFAVPICEQQRPPLEETASGHFVACHRWREVAALPVRETG